MDILELASLMEPKVHKLKTLVTLMYSTELKDHLVTTRMGLTEITNLIDINLKEYMVYSLVDPMELASLMEPKVYRLKTMVSLMYSTKLTDHLVKTQLGLTELTNLVEIRLKEDMVYSLVDPNDLARLM